MSVGGKIIHTAFAAKEETLHEDDEYSACFFISGSEEHEHVEGALDDDEEAEVMSCDVYEMVSGDDDVTQRVYCMREPVALLHGSDSNYRKPAALCWCHRDPPNWHAGTYKNRGSICDMLEVLDVSDENPRWVSRGLSAVSLSTLASCQFRGR